MFVLIPGGFFIGALLARFFKFYSLFPVAVLSIFLILTNPLQLDRSWWGLCIDSAVLVAMLEAGFICGVALQVVAMNLRKKTVPAPRGLVRLAGARHRRHS